MRRPVPGRVPCPARGSPLFVAERRARVDNLLPVSARPGLCMPMTFGLWISVLPLLVVAAACVRVLLTPSPR